MLKPKQVCPVCGHTQTKSNVQRNKFHQLCRTIGKELGLEPGAVKEAIKIDFFGLDEVKVGNKWYRIVRSSEEADKLEYSELIEFAYRWAVDNGVSFDD